MNVSIAISAVRMGGSLVNYTECVELMKQESNLYCVSGQHDDSRMNVSIAISAVTMGGSLVNYTECVELLKQ